MKKISEEKIAIIGQKHFGDMGTISLEYPIEVAQAQLDSYEKEHKKVVKEIFREIEDKGLFQNPKHILLTDKEWQALRQKYGVK
ncbi:hypothetical protein LCGC14_0431310 [marine sediment metagenome]|uniref:Uncharacterized protein n=1 Tax=marine sediment metagenome TaxID=412755 RepID=A0A0F9VA67_9ZZZZ